MSRKIAGVGLILILLGNTSLYSQSKKTIEPKKDTLRYCSGKIISIIETDDNGRYHGTSTRFFRSGKVSERETFKHGNLDGTSIYFYETGDTSETVQYKNGVLNGKVTAFYPNNKILFVEHYFGGKLHHESFYFDTNGTLYNGKFKEYSYQLGLGKVRKVECINGKPEGDLLIYGEESCALLFKLPFKNGLLEGRAIAYTDNGKVSYASLYEKGKYIKEDDSLYKENIGTYTRYLSIDSTNSTILFQRALAHLRLLEKNPAIKDLDKVIKLDPNYYKAYYNRGVLFSDSLPVKAIADFKKCNALKPDFYLAHHNLGFVYFKQKEYKKAIEAFKKALLYKPEYLPSINYLGLVYDVMKDKKKANHYWNLAESIELGKNK